MYSSDLKQKFTVYKITNLLNGKIYIGKHQTTNLDDGYMGSGKLIRAAQKKYGIENFSKEILFIFDSEEEMNAKEAELVNEEFVSREDTYNLCFGGQGGFSHINRLGLQPTENLKYGWFRKRTDLEKKQFSERNIRFHKEGKLDSGKFGNRVNDHEIRRKANSPEAIRKKKETWAKTGRSKGKLNSQYGSMWITNGVENKKIQKNTKIPDNWYPGRKIA